MRDRKTSNDIVLGLMINMGSDKSQNGPHLEWKILIIYTVISLS